MLMAGLCGLPPGPERYRRVQADLRQAEERNRKLVEQGPQVTYIEQLDRASASYISPQIEALVGYTPEELTSDPSFFEQVLHPDDRARVLAGVDPGLFPRSARVDGGVEVL
jgi:PAS domain-containing protein